MPHIIDFVNVSTAGLESSPVTEALAGLRANEARYYKNKYQHQFTVVPVQDCPEILDYVNHLLKEERDLVLSATPLEISHFQVENIRMVYVFYQDGLSLNVMYTMDDPKKRAVGFKLSEGMDVPEELEGKFKFVRQKSKLAGTIRGSFFVIKKAIAPPDPGPFYHGTKADLKPGDFLSPGFQSNYGAGKKANFVYLTATMDAAVWGAELALGDGPGRIFRVVPTGAYEDDPNLTDKKFPGNPTRSYRTREPLRILGEVQDWKGHAPEDLQRMLDQLAELKSQGIEAINE